MKKNKKERHALKKASGLERLYEKACVICLYVFHKCGHIWWLIVSNAARKKKDHYEPTAVKRILKYNFQCVPKHFLWYKLGKGSIQMRNCVPTFFMKRICSLPASGVRLNRQICRGFRSNTYLGYFRLICKREFSSLSRPSGVSDHVLISEVHCLGFLFNIFFLHWWDKQSHYCKVGISQDGSDLFFPSWCALPSLNKV